MKKHLSDLQKKEYSCYLELIAAVINGVTPPVPADEISFNRLYDIATASCTEAIFADAVIELSKMHSFDSEFLKVITEKKNHTILSDTVHNYEIERILSQFEKYQVVNLPMKGYFLKKDYPHSFYRSISDFDILFDISDIDKVKNIFSEIGYKFEKCDEHQYHFSKKPFMYIEMHKDLVPESDNCYPYLANQLKNSLKRDGYEYSRAMSIEDYYVYMIVHASKHFKIGGIGLRMVLDEYIFYKKYSDSFDKEYLAKQLENCGVTVFEKKIRKIAFDWFSENSVKENFNDVEEYILMSFALGRLDVAIMSEFEKNSIKEKNGKKKSRARLFLSSVFPSKSRMVYSDAYLEKFPFLLPFAWGRMWFKRFFIEKNVRIKTGFKNRLAYKEDDVEFFRKIQNEMGFD